MAIKIDKGIPAPNMALAAIDEIKDMEVGDSFFVAECTEAKRSAYVRAAEKLPEFMFLTETLVENGVKGVRFWRIKDRPARKYKPKAPKGTP